jgi:hypothetical protein
MSLERRQAKAREHQQTDRYLRGLFTTREAEEAKRVGVT